MQRFLILILLNASLCAEEKSPSPGKEENWLQKNIEEQQKLQSNRTANEADKINPFQAIAKPNEEKPKSTEPFALIQNKETAVNKPINKIEAPRPINTDTSFKPAVSGMLSDNFNQIQGEKQSRAAVERIDSANKESDRLNTQEEDPIEKARKERIQQNLNSKANDKLFDNKFELPGSFDHPNAETQRKNPYLSENQNRFQQNRDSFGTTPVNNLQTIQMIKPIETPQMIQNPALNRSVFENQKLRNENQKPIYNQMMTIPGTGRSRIQDPNDFLRR